MLDLNMLYLSYILYKNEYKYNMQVLELILHIKYLHLIADFSQKATDADIYHTVLSTEFGDFPPLLLAKLLTPKQK